MFPLPARPGHSLRQGRLPPLSALSGGRLALDDSAHHPADAKPLHIACVLDSYGGTAGLISRGDSSDHHGRNSCWARAGFP